MRGGYPGPPRGRGYSGGRGYDQRGGFRGAPRGRARPGVEGHGVGVGAGSQYALIHDQGGSVSGTRPSDPRDRGRIMGDMNRQQLGYGYDGRVQDNYSAMYNVDSLGQRQSAEFIEQMRTDVARTSSGMQGSGPSSAGPGAGGGEFPRPYMEQERGHFSRPYADQGPGVGRFERDSYVERGSNKEQREYYTESPHESSPEYFSTNYPTQEELEEYGMYQKRETINDKQDDRGRSPEPFQEDEFEYESENPDIPSDPKQQSDIELTPDEGRKSNMSDIEFSPEAERGQKSMSDIDLSPTRSPRARASRRDADFGSNARSNGDQDDRKMDHRAEEAEFRSREDRNPHKAESDTKRDADGVLDRMEGQRAAFGERPSPREMESRDPREHESRSQSSSHPKDMPPPEHRGREQNATSVIPVPKQEDANTSLVITVTNDQCPSKEEGPPSAIDRLGPPIPQMKDAAERLGPPVDAAANRLGPSVVSPAERLGPSVAAPQERLGPKQGPSGDQRSAPGSTAVKGSSRKEKLPPVGDDDFDLYADIPPPEKEQEEIRVKEPKEELVITFQNERTDFVPTTSRTPGVFPSAQLINAPATQSQPEPVPNQLEQQSEQRQDVTQGGTLESGKNIPEVSVVTIPKSKWESDEEGSDKHLILLPKAAQKPEPKVDAVVKKRDPTLHVGQIVKDVRYKTPNPAKLQVLIGECKPKAESKGDSKDSKKHKGDSKKKSKHKRRDRSRSRSRSRERNRSRSRERDRRERHMRDRRRSRSDSRERRQRKESRSDSRDKTHYVSIPYRGRGSFRGGRGRGRDVKPFDSSRNRFDLLDRPDDRRRDRSRSRDRDRHRSRRDRRRSRSRSSSSSSYSSSSSWSSSGSSYSSRSRSRSKSPVKSKKRVDKKVKDVKQKNGDKSNQKKIEKTALVEKPPEKDEKSEELVSEAKKTYDIFSGELVEEPKVKKNEGTFAKAGGLPDPLGLKQLTKPMKSKVYSGPIYDMPPLTVAAVTEQEPKKPPVLLAAAKPLKSILKKKKSADEKPEEATSSIPSNSQGSTVEQLVQGSSGPDLAQLTSILSTLVPQGTQTPESVASLLSAINAQQQRQEQEQQKLKQQQQLQQLQQQLLQQQQQLPQQQNLGIFGSQLSSNIPGLGNQLENPTVNPGLMSFIGGLGGQQSIPGLDGSYNTPQGLGVGGILTSSITGFGGIPSAATNTSIPGLGDTTQNMQHHMPQQPQVSQQQQPSQNLASILQNSGLKMTPELSAVLGGTRRPDQNPAGFGAQPAFQSGGMPASQNIPFLSGMQAAAEEEDQFLYGEPQQASQYADPNKYPSQSQNVPFQSQGQFGYPGQSQSSAPEEYIPEAKPETTQSDSSVDTNHIQKILSAIGFDFDMAKKVQLEKELGLHGKKAEQKPQQTQQQTRQPTQQTIPSSAEQSVQKSSYDQVSEYVSAQRIQAQQSQTQQAAQQHTAAPEYKMEGLNQTASFLDTGLQVPVVPAEEKSKKLSKKKKKKAEKAEKKKLKEEKAALKGKSASNEKDSSKKGYQEGLGQKDKSRTGKSGSKSPLTEPISDEELDQTTPKKHQQYAELANIKIQVAQTASSSASDSKRRIVLLPHEQENPELQEERRHVTREQTSGKWSEQDQPYHADEYVRHDWEMKERRLLEEQLRMEWQMKEEKEKEKRRKEMLKKEQEWLMREVALKTMEEKIRREEEKLLQVKEQNKRQGEKLRREEEKLIHDWELMRRQESKRKATESASEANRQQKLREERDKIQKKLVVLEKALDSLKKQQGEMMRRKQHTKDGHLDPQLVHNGKLQDEISDQIKSLRKSYADVDTKEHDRDAEKSGRENRARESRDRESRDRESRDRGSRDRESRDRESRDRGSRDRGSRDAKERRSRSTDRSSSSRDDRAGEKGKSSSSHRKRSSMDGKEEKESKARFQFTYVDNGDHWCKVCQKALRNLNEFFIHLHSKKHMKLIDPMDRPWISSDNKSETSASTESRLPAPVKGAEFVMPVNGFYCRLCKMFLGDGICGSEHMKDPSHNLAYQKLLDENKHYEKQLELDRASAGATPMVVKEEDGNGKGNKRKAEDEPEDKQSKQVKSEPPDVKVSTKKSGGFGKFEFSKQQEPSAPAPPPPAPEPPLELRKDSGQGNSDATSKKDPNKLTIKLGSSKRLIPSALLRGKTAQATPTSVATSEAGSAVASAADTTASSVTTRTRSARSTTLAQRPQPMIGKRPTRRSKDQPKEPPKESQAEESVPSSLDDFLLGSSGEALPVITDVKTVTEEIPMPEGKPKEQDEDASVSKGKPVEDEFAEEFVVKDSVTAGGSKSETEYGNPNDMEFIQIDEASDDEVVEMPEIPGGAEEEESSLPAPIPPPPAD